MKKDRQAMIKSMPGMMKGNDDGRKMDRPMLMDSTGIGFKMFSECTCIFIQEIFVYNVQGLWTLEKISPGFASQGCLLTS